MQQTTPWSQSAPRGLPAVVVPVDDPMTVEKVELGRLLFYDRRVASQPDSACADCHEPDHGFAGHASTMSFHRNAPTALNRAYGDYEFWDGSAGRSLEQLARGVLRFVNEGAARPCWERLDEVPAYHRAFRRAFGRGPDEDAVVQALASFSRTLLAGDSPFDRGALSEAAARGHDVFVSSGCGACHAGPNFTDEQFHDIGIGQEQPHERFYAPGARGKPDFPELGRFNVTHRIEDRGAFKTPTLRELTRTGPYMHDGRFDTLEAVVDYYDLGGPGLLGMDARVHPLHLSQEQKADLVELLKALSSNAPPPTAPLLPEP